MTALSIVALAIVFGSCLRIEDRWPAKPADFVSTDLPNLFTKLKFRPLDPDETALIGPHFLVGFSAVAISEVNTPQRYRAAPGHELVIVFPANPAGPPDYPLLRTEDKIEAAVVVDGVSRPLPGLPTQGLIVSVPKGHDATLQIVDDGKAQSLELRAGTRGTDAVAPYYRRRGVKGTGEAYHDLSKASFAGLHVTVDVSATFDQASSALRPWLQDHGWAKPGRIWLVVSGLSLQAVTKPEDADPIKVIATAYLTYAVDLNRSFALALPGATAAPLPQPPRDTIDYGTGFTFGVAFDVPDTFTGGTLAFKPVGDFYGPGQSIVTPGSKADLRPFVFSRPLAAGHPFPLALAT